MSIKICASGDLMLLEHFPLKYDFSKLASIIKDCDIGVTNLETVISNWDCHASTFCGGQWINAEPDVLEDISCFGFNLYGCANNHSMDYSYDGLLSTRLELINRGWMFAGIGRSLAESSKPVYYEVPDKKIKVAFISATSTFIDAARAGDARDVIPPRPGINPLRVQTKYLVSKEHFEQLKEIAQVSHINGERDNARRIGSLPPEEEGSINFGGSFFVVGEGEEGKNTYCNVYDLERILGEVRKAKEKADYVIISIHSHQIKKDSYNEPDFFLEEFAHKCVDAGACAILGSGTHQLKPIEIYKGVPIFYSLGNFVFENHRVKKLPADFWDKYHYPIEWTVETGLNQKTKNGTIGLEVDKNNYLSILPIIEYEKGKLKDLKILPIELNFTKKELKGLPSIAGEEDSQKIFEHLRIISDPYGTKLRMDKYITVGLKNEK